MVIRGDDHLGVEPKSRFSFWLPLNPQTKGTLKNHLLQLQAKDIVYGPHIVAPLLCSIPPWIALFHGGRAWLFGLRPVK